MAVNRQKPQNDLIFHSDRGVQYASAGYREALAEYNITQSMSRKGEPYDNAVAENFFSCLKCELVHHKHYRTRSEAQADIFAYIEAYYNSMRPQSALNWLSPLEYEHLLSIYAAKVAWQWVAGVIGLCRGELPSGSSFFRRYIMPAEAHCQANRGINAVGFSKLTKYCDSFRFLKLFCVHFCWEGTPMYKLVEIEADI